MSGELRAEGGGEWLHQWLRPFPSEFRFSFGNSLWIPFAITLRGYKLHCLHLKICPSDYQKIPPPM